MKAAAFEFTRASSVEEAIRLISHSDGGTKIGGGTQSLGPMLNLRLAQFDQVVDVSRLPELKSFEMRGDLLSIGAAVTHARIEDGELPDVTLGLLPSVASNIAYRAVRNRGTIGGSLAHADPAADWVTTVYLLNATIVIAGPSGLRRLRPEEFFLGTFTTALEMNELIVAVEVPKFSDAARWSYRKNCRKPGEFADAIGAVLIDPARKYGRAVIGALGGMPTFVDGVDRVRALGQSRNLDSAIDDAGIEDEYEREVHRVMLKRALGDLQIQEG